MGSIGPIIRGVVGDKIVVYLFVSWFSSYFLDYC